MSSRLFCNPASNAVALSLAATRPARLRKGLILAATMLLWVSNLLAQLPGTVHFANQTSSAISNELAGRPVALADDIRAALYWAPLGASVFKQIGPSVSVGSTR